MGCIGGKRLPAKSVTGENRNALVCPPERPHGYRLGTLDQARDAFTNTTGLTVDWDS
jgi:hypothetical protein